MKTLLRFIGLLFIASNMIAQTPRWTTYDNNNTNGSLPLVICLATDASGNIWIGSYRTLVKYDQGTTWTIYNSSNSLVPNDNNVIDVAVDNSNNIWACTYSSGLLNYNGSTWQQYLPSNSGILSNYTYCVGFDTPGNVWTGILSANSSNAGLVKWDRNSTWTPYNTFFDGYNYKNVEAIAKDNAGNIWCGTSIGLYKYDPTNSTWTVYTKENTSGGLGGNWVRVITTDTAGNIWLGTMDLVNYSYVGTGLTKFTPSTNLWSNYIANSQDPSSQVVSAIAIRNNNQVWVGTGFCGQYNGNGLYKFENSTWTNYANDLSTFPTSCVNDLVVDKNNNLWIASGAGLTKVDFNPTAVEEYIETIPTQYSLNAYPNPFNPTTKIEFSIPKAGKYTIKVYNTLGQEVSLLVDHELVAGIHSVTFDASGLASGIYICKLSGNNVSLSKKIVLMK